MTSSSVPSWNSWCVCLCGFFEADSDSGPHLRFVFLSFQHAAILTWTQIGREIVSYRWEMSRKQSEGGSFCRHTQASTHKTLFIIYKSQCPASLCWHFRSFHPFCPPLRSSQPPRLQLWAVWAIHLVCSHNSKSNMIKYCFHLLIINSFPHYRHHILLIGWFGLERLGASSKFELYVFQHHTTAACWCDCASEVFICTRRHTRWH